MSKKVNRKAPKLRFSEFYGDWTEKKLSEISNKISDGIHSTPKYDENGEYYFINGNNLINSRIEFDENTKRIDISEYLKYKSDLTSQTILVSINGTIGNLSFYGNEKIILGKSACYINLKSEENKFFAFYLLQTSSTKKHFNKEVTGSTIKNLSLTTIKNTKALFPSEKEQEKIASFFGAVDNRLTQLRRKHELLQTYKRGVMQKIFSQQIRFKDDDGKPFPDWEKKKLSDFSEPVKRQLESGEVVVMSISSGKGFVTQNERFSQVIAGSSLKKYILLKKHEFAYNRGASKLFPFGCIYMLTQEDFALIPFVYRAFQLKQGNRSFFAHYFLTGYLDKQLKEVISSSVRMDGLLNIGETDFFNISLPFPDKKEQEKIAVFLTAIDQKIEAVAKQIELTEKFKKGLLQKMFV